MPNPLLTILRTGLETFRAPFPDLPAEAAGLPTVSAAECAGEDCGLCVASCPTSAIVVLGKAVTLDRGRCIGCDECVRGCPTGTLVADRSTQTATRTREELVLSNEPKL